MEWLIKKGNTAILEAELEDQDGNAITDLNLVTEAKFQVKEEKDSATVKLEVTLGDGVEVNQPSTSWVRITLSPAQTKVLSAKSYFMGLQLKWSDGEIYEPDIKISDKLTEILRVKQDVVNT